MVKSIRIFGVILLILSGCLLGSAGLLAQEGGTIKGKVIDRNEKFPLPTVRVSVAGVKKYALSAPDGSFTIKGVPPGVYKVVFEVAGYLTETVKDVTVAAGETAEVNASMSMGFAHGVTVTARREVESLQKVPQNVEILTETKLAETPQVNVVQALNSISGVDVETGSGNTTTGTFMYIDGYEDIYIRKMVDGVDVGEVVGNWSLLNAYSENMIDHVEVIKGGASSVWGSNMGGIVNIVTKRPKDMAKPVFTLKGTYSKYNAMDFTGANAIGQSGDLYKLSFSAMGNIQKFGYLVGYDNDRNDGFVDYGREKNNSAFGKFSYDLGENTKFDLLLNRNTMNTQTHAFLNLESLLGPEFPFYWNYRADYKAVSDMASLKFSTNLNPTLNLEAQLKYNRLDFKGATEYLAGSMFQPPAGTIDNAKYIDQKTGFTLKGAYTPGEEFSLISGVDYYRIKADFSGYIANQPIVYVDTVAPFLNAEYRTGNLGLHAGLRYDYDSSFGNQLSPSVGATFNFGNASLIRANVARTFKVPPLWYTLGQSYFDMILPNPNLKPERAWAYSAGIESQELRYIYVKVSGYYHLMTDGIVRVPADIEGRYTWGNISKFTRKGYEAQIGFLTDFGLTGYIGTNYNKHEDTTGSNATVLTWIPTRTYKGGLKYKVEKWDFFANFQARWIWWNMDPDNAFFFNPTDKKWIIDFRASKGFRLPGSTHLGIFLDVFNLTNQAYWDRSDMPNPRRWAQLGFEFEF
jgi:vitamin B12 transporter